MGTAKVMPMTQRRRRRIEWTDEERNKIIERAAHIWLNEPLAMQGPVALLKRAQAEALPVERQRPIISVIGEAWFTTGVETRVLNVHEQLTRANAPEPEPPPPPPSWEEMTAEVSTDMLIGAAVQRVLYTMMDVDGRLSEIEHRMLGRLNQTHALVMQLIGELAKHDVVKVSHFKVVEERKRDLHIMVVGLLEAQQERVRQACKDLPVKFTFAQKKSTKPEFPDLLDHVYVTKWSNHAWSIEARKLFGTRYSWHDGGVEQLAERIRRLVIDVQGLKG